MSSSNRAIDLDKYKNPNETEKEWRLKSQFIEKFQDQFDEDRLICLAQCFVNIETMGCRYSNEIMKQIKELTSDFRTQDSSEPSRSAMSLQQTKQNISKKQLNNEIKFVKSTYNNTSSSNNMIKQQAKPQQPTKQIQILSRNTKQSITEIKTKQPHNSQFQTITQLNQVKSATFVSTSPPKTFNFNQTNKSSPNTNQQIKFSSNTTPKTNSKQSSGKLNSSATLACPSSTTEQSPAPSLVPIPFGLATPDSFTSSVINKLDFSENPSISTSNALFSSLFLPKQQQEEPIEPVLTFNTFNKSNPLSILINSKNASTLDNNNSTKNSFEDLKQTGDTQFQKLTKLTKLRNLLRSDAKISNYINDPSPNLSKEIIEYFKQMCLKNSIKLDYVQYVSTNDNNKSYIGEIYLENFRLIKVQDVKRKRCSTFAHKKALILLHGPSELAVQVAPQCKRDSNMKLDDNNNNNEIEFEYELYLVNSDQSTSASFSTLNEFNGKYDDDDYDDDEENETANSKVEENHIFHLNTMLRSLLLPNCKASSNETENQIIEDDDNEDDENDDTTTSITRKNRIREAIPNFCIFLSGNESATLVHERNSISILTNSCVKSNYNLEFELKIKGQQLSIKMQLDDSEDEEEITDLNAKKKYKCKCLINHVKITSAHGKTRIECKRQAALKAITYLSKMYPILQDTSYQSEMQSDSSLNHQQESCMSLPPMHLSTTTSSLNYSQQRYFKISKEDLFKGLVPPTLFETLSNNLAQTTASDLGNRLLLKMGWKGQGYGLGRMQQGITEPIALEVNKCRLGFGCPYVDDYADELKQLDNFDHTNQVVTDNNNNNNKTNVKRNRYETNKGNIKRDFINNIVSLLRNFVSSPAENDLVFEKSLSSDDRKLIHREANRLGLKTRSEGSGDDRFLVVKKKRSTNEIVEAALKNGGHTSSFKLISSGKNF